LSEFINCINPKNAKRTSSQEKLLFNDFSQFLSLLRLFNGLFFSLWIILTMSFLLGLLKSTRILEEMCNSGSFLFDLIDLIKQIHEIVMNFRAEFSANLVPEFIPCKIPFYPEYNSVSTIRIFNLKCLKVPRT
jgi:hypothetical protein